MASDLIHMTSMQELLTTNSADLIVLIIYQISLVSGVCIATHIINLLGYSSKWHGSNRLGRLQNQDGSTT